MNCEKHAFVACDVFVIHLAFDVGDRINDGAEILPMSSLQQQMSSGMACDESKRYHGFRQGRRVAAVPNIMIGLGG